VQQALEASGATALIVTHDQAEALTMGQQVAVLWQGKLLQVDAPQQLYRQPLTAELAGFIGDAVLLDGMAEEGMVNCALGRLPLRDGPKNGRVNVLLRPEQIRLRDAAAHPDAPRARIEQIDFYGHDACVRLRLPTLTSPLLARVPGHQSLQRGSEVALQVEGRASAFLQPA